MLDLFLNDCGAQWTNAWFVTATACLTSVCIYIAGRFREQGAFFRGKIEATEEMKEIVEEEVLATAIRLAKEGKIVLRADDTPHLKL